MVSYYENPNRFGKPLLDKIMRRRLSFFLIPLVAILMILALGIIGQPPCARADDASLELPRFRSLKSDRVNVRTGPGPQYPIYWVYQRRALPVKIVAEFDNWRRIRDSEGVEGWVLYYLLSNRRTALVTGGLRPLRQTAAATAAPVAQLEAGVIVTLASCDPLWCQVSVDGMKGWLPRDQIWGLLPGEKLP